MIQRDLSSTELPYCFVIGVNIASPPFTFNLLLVTKLVKKKTVRLLKKKIIFYVSFIS